VLFPNINGFVDTNAIHIFLTKNLVSTLLAGTYHSIHHITIKQDETILCCAPLLYKWYTMHLPQSYLSKEKGVYSKKIMALTPTEIVWYIPAYDSGTIIDSCGEFNNVPLIEVHGGINYNPILARRQFKYPVEGKPCDIVLERVFYHNHVDNLDMRQRFAEAWKTIHKKDSNHLGKKSDFVHETYVQWIIDRAMTYGMPYTLPRLLTLTTLEIPLPLLPQTKEDYQRLLHEANRESASWKVKYQTSERENDTIMGILEQKTWELKEKVGENAELKDLLKRKDVIIDRMPESRRRSMDFFAGAPSDSEE